MIVGLDEAGVGALMGPMVAAAVIFSDGFDTTGLCDSKTMSATRRQREAKRILASCFVGVGEVSNAEIDDLGMAECRRLVFHRALDALGEEIIESIDKIIVDGTLFKEYRCLPHECVPRADATIPVVSAASIVAKEHRDAHVRDVCQIASALAERYGWRTNMGYPTAAHLEGLRTHGVAPEHHRLSFGPCTRIHRDAGSSKRAVNPLC